jgi:hypothetical protein
MYRPLFRRTPRQVCTVRGAAFQCWLWNRDFASVLCQHDRLDCEIARRRSLSDGEILKYDVRAVAHFIGCALIPMRWSGLCRHVPAAETAGTQSQSN